MIWQGCKPADKQNLSEKNDVDLKIKRENSEKPSLEEIPKSGRHAHTFHHGDSTFHKIYEDGLLLYQAVEIKGKPLFNHFYPLIRDAFLFEDKYYLKISFLIKVSGDISFALPDNPDYEKTQLAASQHQIVINDALDLDRIKFRLTYRPSDRDSLIASTYTYQYVIFE